MSGADLVVAPHPLTLEGRTITQGAELRPGDTLLDFLTRAGVDLTRGGWVVTIGGAVVPEMMWARTKPKHGQVIECRRRAAKQVLYVVAILVLAYFTMGASLGATTIGAAAVGVGGSAIAAAAINVGVYMVGSMLINKWLGPTQAKGPQYSSSTGSSTVYSLSGSRNKARPFEPLGLVFGSVRVVPDYAAQPYSWFEGEDQIIYCRFQAGVNAGAVSELKIGGTDISAFTDVAVAQSGFPSSAAQLLDWSNVDTVAGGALTAPSAPGGYVTRTSSSGSKRLAVDVGGQIYSMDGGGGFSAATVDIEMQRRQLPTGAWLPFSGASAVKTLTSRSTKPVRVTFVTEDLEPGQYEVRMRKLTSDATDSNAGNQVEWGSLKSYQADSGTYASYPQVGIRIKATGQLNGTLDELTWLLQQKATPVWNGSAWVTQTTSNPGAHILQFARGIYDGSGRLMAGLGLPDGQIDIEGLQAFMLHCAANNYRFDHYFDAQLSCGDVLEALAAAGMGSISMHPGKLSVVWASSSDPVEAVIAMGNIKAGSFRVDYITRTTAEELEVTGLDRDNDWRPASVRIMAPGVTVPRETARYAPVGQTTLAGLVREARKTMGQNLYGRKSVTWEMDLEHLTFRRFSVVALSHDLTQWGYSGRLHSAVAPGGVVTLELDAEVPFNGSASTRKVLLRVPGETGYRVFSVQAFSGTAHTLTLVEAWPSGVPFPGDSASNPAHDYLWIYDFKATPGQRLRVVSIEPAANLGGAKITATPETDEFWTYMASGTYTVPTPTSFTTPLVVSNVQITQERNALTYDLSTELTVTFDVAGQFDHAQVWGGATDTVLELLGETRTRSFGPKRVTFESSYYVEVRPFDALGRPGAKGVTTYGVLMDDPLGLARVLQLVPSTQFFKIDAGGTATPANIVLTAVAPGFTGVPVFTVISGTATLTGAGTARTLAYTNMGSDACTVKVEWGGQADQVTLLKVRDSGGTYSFVLKNESRNIACTADGTPTAGLPIDSQFFVIKDGALLTSGVVFSVGTVSGFTGVSIHASTGVIAITGITADSATAEFIATVGGTLMLKRELQATKIRAGASGGTGFAVEITIHKQAASEPPAPSGGSYKFNGDVFVAPVGWQRALITSSTVPVWASRWLFKSTDINAVVPGPSSVGTLAGVKLLLHGNGTNGSTTLTDSSVYAKTPSSVGSAVISTAISTAYGGAAIRFPKGAPITYAPSADWNMNDGDFTLSVRAMELSSNSLGSLVSRRNAISTQGWCFTTANFRANVNGAWSDDQLAWTRPPFNEWHTYTLVKFGTTLLAFVDGILVASKTDVTAVLDMSAQSLFIGQADSGSENRFDGYFEEVLFAKYAIWTSAFTPPSSAFSIVPPGSVLALYFVGANGSTTFTDYVDSPHTFTRHGTPTISTTQLIGGKTTLALNGTTDWISTPDSGDWNLGAGDFEMEVQFVLTALPSNFAGLIAKSTSSANYGEFSLGVVSNGIIQFGATTGGNQSSGWNLVLCQSAVGAIAVNTPYQVVLNRVGNLFRLWLQGSLVGSATATGAITDSTARLTVGANIESGAFKAQGFIGLALITKGTVRYTEPFSPVFGIDGAGAGGWPKPIKVYQDGLSGVMNAQVRLYQRAASTPALPSATVTYNFSTGVATGLTNGWQQTIPAGSNPVFITEATAVSTTGATTDTIAPGEWPGAQSLGSGGSAGANGLNSSPVFLYQRTATATPPALPSADVTYTFSSPPVVSGMTNGWQQTLPTAGGSFRWLISATAITAAPTDTIPPTEWAGPALISQDGSDGNDGAPSVALKLSADSVSIPADSSGYIASYAMAITIASVEVGGVVDDGWTFGAVFGTGIGGVVAGSLVSVTSLMQDYGYVDVTAVKDGYPDQVKTFTVTRVRSAGTVSGDLFGAYFDAASRSRLQARAGIQFLPDGRVQIQQGTGFISPIYTDAGNWFAPTTSGVGPNRWIRVTRRTGGSGLAADTSGAWVSMASPQDFFLQSVANVVGGALMDVLDYEISNSSTGTPVVGGGVLELSADAFG